MRATTVIFFNLCTTQMHLICRFFDNAYGLISNPSLHLFPITVFSLKFQGLSLSVNFWDRHQAQFMVKIQKSSTWRHSWDWCADKASVELYYDGYFKWNMPILGEICCAKQKYMPRVWFERDSRKKTMAQKHIQIDTVLCGRFLSKPALDDSPAYRISRIHR